MRKNISKAGIVAVILVIGYLATSLFMYQRLVNEGSVLADNQCLKINPIIIAKRIHYINSIKAYENEDFADYEGETEAYFTRSEQFVVEQNNWLEAQRKYMNKWDYKFFLPEYIKKAAQYQYDSRKYDAESSQLLIEAHEISQLNRSIAEDLSLKSTELIKKRNEADNKYEEIWDNPGKLDWRTRFIKVPESKCPEENFDIPEVENELNPPSINSPLS